MDGLRGLALLCITLFHLWRVPGQQPIWFLNRVNLTPLFPNGADGVVLFFVLSGFSLYLPLARANRGGASWPSWKGFMYRRAVRILPAYWLALALWSPLWARQHGWTDWPRFMLTHVTFTHTFWPDTVFAISGVLWAMGTIGQFYVIFPLLAMAMRRWPALVASICFAVSLVLRMEFAASVPLAASLPGHLADFALGMYAARLLVSQEQAIRPSVARVIWAVAAILLIAFPYWFTAIKQDQTAASLWDWRSVLQAPLWAALATGVVLDRSRWTAMWSWKPLTLLGLVSYSLYLYNYSIYWIPNRLFPAVAAGSGVWWVLTFLSVVAVGAVGHLVAERPLAGVRAKLRSQATLPARSQARRRQ